MSPNGYVEILGVGGMCLGLYGLIHTFTSRAAVLRGGRRVTRERNPHLYWANVLAICALILISAGLAYFASR
jgi:hypothetical protein